MTASQRSGRLLLLLLLVLAVGINYIDRGCLSVAGPVLQVEFSLSDSQLGFLLSAFFWSYAVFQLVAGWLVDRYDVKWVYAGGFFLWSLAMAATGLTAGFGALCAMRLLLGIGESVAYPATSRIIALNFPEEQRGLANSLVDAGCKIGPGLSTLVGGLLVDKYGWRALFWGVGIGSLLWLLPWIMLVPGAREARVPKSEEGPGMLEILRRPDVWGTSLAMFCLGYSWYFLLTWLPSYLVKERHFSMTMMAWFGSLPFWGMALASVAGGWSSDRWISKGGSPTLVRKTFVVTGQLLCGGLMVPAVLVNDPSMAVGLLIAACISLGIFTSNVWAITQTLAGPTAAGKWTGIQNFIGNLGGVVSPMVTGLIVQHTGSFVLAFAAAATMLVIGALTYLTLIGDIAPLRWDKKVGSAEPA